MIRTPVQGDQSYVASTWWKSIMRETRPSERHPTMRTGPQLSALIDRTLDRADTRCLIRARAHDRDAIMGWVVYVEGAGVPIIHYLYVRKDDRQRGIGTALLMQAGVMPNAGVVCTSQGPSSAMLRVRYPAATYMPLAEFLSPNKVT